MPLPELGASIQPHVYVYGLVRGDGVADSPAGIGGAAVRIVAEGGIGALASELAAGLDVEMRDPDTAKAAVLAHHGVLQAVVGRQTVLPLRFGTVFCDDGGIRSAIAAHRGFLVEALQRLDGSREWGVKIFCDRDVLGGGIGAVSPALSAAEKELSGAPQGKAFFLRRRMAQMREREIDRTLAHDLEDLRRCLRELSHGEAAMKLQAPAVTGRCDEMVWNGAYLVMQAQEAPFFERIEAVMKALEPLGYHCDVTGPWPPFNFADCSLEA